MQDWRKASLYIRNKFPSPHFLPPLCLTPPFSCSSKIWTLSPAEKGSICLSHNPTSCGISLAFALSLSQPLGIIFQLPFPHLPDFFSTRSPLQTGGRKSQSTSSVQLLPGTCSSDTVQSKGNAHNTTGLLTVTMTIMHAGVHNI